MAWISRITSGSSRPHGADGAGIDEGRPELGSSEAIDSEAEQLVIACLGAVTMWWRWVWARKACGIANRPRRTMERSALVQIMLGAGASVTVEAARARELLTAESSSAVTVGEGAER